MPSSSERIYWTRDSAADVSTWTMRYNAWPGQEWYALRSGDSVPSPGDRIMAETSIHRMGDGTYMARTVRVNTTGPNYRRTVWRLDRTGAQWQCDHWQLVHERYALGRLGVRVPQGYVPSALVLDAMGLGATPVCDWCNGTEEDSPGMDWDGDEGMHVDCIQPMRESMGRLIGDPGHRLDRRSVPLPQPDRPRLSSVVPSAHPGWFV